jgi:hypothetical protein
MKYSLSSLKQYHLLIIILVFIFGASAVFLVFERARNEAASGVALRAKEQPLQAVEGASVVRDKAIASYQEYARETAGSIQAMVKGLSSGAPADLESAKELASSLLQAKVPLPYQALHFKLLKLVRNLSASQGPDINFLQEQLRFLSDGYPWLFSPQSQGQ